MAQTEQSVDHYLMSVVVTGPHNAELRQATCTCGYQTEWWATLPRLLESWTAHRIQTEHQWFRDLAATTLYAAEARQ